MPTDRFTSGNWLLQAEAIRTAYRSMGEPNDDGDIPDRDWNLVGWTLKHYRLLHPKCNNCQQELAIGEDIRCRDCKVVYCDPCALKHFQESQGGCQYPRPG